MKNEEKSNIVSGNNSENIAQKQIKNSRLYMFMFLVDEEIGNSLIVKAFHELNEENQENKILVNKNNSIKIELVEIKKSKETENLIKSTDGIIFINNFHKENKLNKIMELIKNIGKKIKKSNSKKFFPKLFIGIRNQLMTYFKTKHQNDLFNDIYIFEFQTGKPFTIYTSCEYLIKIIQIRDNYARLLTENKIDEKNSKKI